jgi:hypothetical protein
MAGISNAASDRGFTDHLFARDGATGWAQPEPDGSTTRCGEIVGFPRPARLTTLETGLRGRRAILLEHLFEQDGPDRAA